MDDDSPVSVGGRYTAQAPAIRFLVESALRKLKFARGENQPTNRSEWVEHLCAALMSESETSHHSVLASLMATGVTSKEINAYFIPAAARRLGELWVQDEASFVDVTVGAGRLQALFRSRDIDLRQADPCIPLGQCFLMVIPDFEDHSLGAFVAADQLRRHGVWVHMGIGLKNAEIAEIVDTRPFCAVGLSVATMNTVDKVTRVVDYLRANLDHVPPIVVGGRAVTDTARIVQRTGADHAVRSAREAIERCGLATVGSELSFEQLG